MYITDINGAQLEVTDLEGAIVQATIYTDYRHMDSTPAQRNFDRKVNAYWADLRIKLDALKKSIES